MTGTKEKASSIYVIQKNKRVFSKQISTKTSIVPTIAVDKNILKKGNGTIDSPFEME